jgi:hypothetical protein
MDEAPILTLIRRRSQRSALPHGEGAFPAPPTKREGKFAPVDPAAPRPAAASEEAGDDPPAAASEGSAVPRPAPALEAAGGDREVPHPRSRRPASSSRIPSAASSDALPLLDSRGGEPCQVAWGANSGRRREAGTWRGDDASDGEARGGIMGRRHCARAGVGRERVNGRGRLERERMVGLTFSNRWGPCVKGGI